MVSWFGDMRPVVPDGRGESGSMIGHWVRKAWW